MFQTHLKPPSKSLLIYTRTGVDSCGRRHSVSIPLHPSSKSKGDSAVITIKRKESTKSEKGKEGNLGKIRETVVDMSGDITKDNVFSGVDASPGMDCLTVPLSDYIERAQDHGRGRTSPPSRKRSTSSEREFSRRSSRQGNFIIVVVPGKDFLPNIFFSRILPVSRHGHCSLTT